MIKNRVAIMMGIVWLCDYTYGMQVDTGEQHGRARMRGTALHGKEAICNQVRGCGSVERESRLCALCRSGVLSGHVFQRDESVGCGISHRELCCAAPVRGAAGEQIPISVVFNNVQHQMNDHQQINKQEQAVEQLLRLFNAHQQVSEQQQVASQQMSNELRQINKQHQAALQQMMSELRQMHEQHMHAYHQLHAQQQAEAQQRMHAQQQADAHAHQANTMNMPSGTGGFEQFVYSHIGKLLFGLWLVKYALTYRPVVGTLSSSQNIIRAHCIKYLRIYKKWFMQKYAYYFLQAKKRKRCTSGLVKV